MPETQRHDSRLEAKPRLLDQSRPLLLFGLDEVGEFLRRTADRVEATAGEALLNICAPDGLHDLAAEFAHDVLRRALWGHHAIPLGRVDAGEGLPGQGRHARQPRPAALATPRARL